MKGGGGQGYVQNSDGDYGSGHYGSAQCSASGKITTTFTWNPSYTGEKPPKAVVVEEYCEVYAQGRAGGPQPLSTDASADNGHEHPVVNGPDTNSANLVGRTRTSSGTRYKVKYPLSDGTITLECSPAASASASASGPMKQTIMRIKYRATLHPVSINLLGSTPDGGSLKVLAGQQITAQISGLPLSLKDPDAGGFFWTIGGSVFKDYTYSSVPCVVEPITSTDRSAANGVSFFTKMPETLIVTFSGDLIVPSGALPQPTLHLEVQSENLMSLKPDLIWNTSPEGENTGLFNNQFEQSFGALSFYKPINITVPSPFVGGEGCVAQLVKTERSMQRHPVNGKPATYYAKLPIIVAGTTTWVTPPKGLDAAFPYPNSFTYDSENRRTQVSTWNVGSNAASGDAPRQHYTPSVDDGGGDDWYRSNAFDTFNTYVMYRPPAVTTALGTQATTWVPLKVLNWSWKASVVKTGNAWGWFYNLPDEFPYMAVPSGTQSTDNHPTWDFIISGLEYVP